MQILQPYNESTLQLISDESSYEFQPGYLLGSSPDGVIKLSVFSDINSFLDAGDLQQGIDFYINEGLFLKPNEYLDRAGFSEGNYNLQFDFLVRLDTSQFHISEISPSRKEVRLAIPAASIPDDHPDETDVDDILEFMKNNMR